MKPSFKGRILVDNTVAPMTPGHMIYMWGWLNHFADENPGRRGCLAIVKPLDVTAIEIEIYYPESVNHLHVEYFMPNMVDVSELHQTPEEPTEPDQRTGGLKPPVGEA